VPHKEIAVEVAKTYLKSVVPKLDTEKWLKIYYYTSSFSKNPRWFKPKSIDDIPDAKNPYANDTSVCSGYWPLSLTERLALLMESYFYNPDYSPRFSYIGQDIKVMCVRKRDNIEITMCVPFFSKDTPSREIYFERKEVLYKSLYDLAINFVGDSYSIELFLNTQDEMVKKDPKSVGHYFVISGSALDSGEEGLVGRGNRSRGIISSIRPNSLEAIWGKNPVYYVGKIYNYLADIIAKKIAEDFNCECSVFISSKNGDPISRPDNIFIETSKKTPKKDLISIIDAELNSQNLTRKIIYNKPFIPIPGGGHGYSSF